MTNLRSLCTLLPLLAATARAYDPQNLFPIPVLAGFTTSPAVTPKNVQTLQLDDKVLGVIKVSSGTSHDVVTAPGSAPKGTQAYEAIYPPGSYHPDALPRGGFGFYLNGPAGFDFTSANELLFSYAVMFQQGFEFNMGGKLPGPYGGTNADTAFACSGGRQDGRDQCFDLRLMWRSNAAGEIYGYLPETPANDVLNQLNGSVEDKTFGFSIARGAFHFATGDWTVVAQRVKLNSFSSGTANTDGELELWVNGKSVIHATGLVIRADPTTVFRGAHMQTFFGGDTADWASPINQTSWFADISAASVASGASSEDGGAPYPLSSGAPDSPSGTSGTGSGSSAGSGGNSGAPAPSSGPEPSGTEGAPGSSGSNSAAGLRVSGSFAFVILSVLALF